MNVTDVAAFVGWVFAAWSVGFSAGWSVTSFRDALSKI